MRNVRILTALIFDSRHDRIKNILFHSVHRAEKYDSKLLLEMPHKLFMLYFYESLLVKNHDFTELVVATHFLLEISC